MWKSRLGKHQGKVKHCRKQQGLKLVNLFNLEASHKDQVFLNKMLAHNNLCALSNQLAHNNLCALSNQLAHNTLCALSNQLGLNNLCALSNQLGLNNLHNSCLVSSNFQFSRKCSALNRFQISFLASRFLNSKLSS